MKDYHCIEKDLNLVKKGDDCYLFDQKFTDIPLELRYLSEYYDLSYIEVNGLLVVSFKIKVESLSEFLVHRNTYFDFTNSKIKKITNFDQYGRMTANNCGIEDITGLNQYNRLYLDYNNISSLKGFIQRSSLSLKCNNIISLDGFKQNGFLDLKGNEITSLKGFKQTNYLDLRGNPINNLDGFEFSMKHPFKFDGIITFKIF